MISALIVCAALSVVDGDTIKCDGQNMLLLGGGVVNVRASRNDDSCANDVIRSNGGKTHLNCSPTSALAGQTAAMSDHGSGSLTCQGWGRQPSVRPRWCFGRNGKSPLAYLVTRSSKTSSLSRTMKRYRSRPSTTSSRNRSRTARTSRRLV